MPAYSPRASTLVAISNELMAARRIYPDTAGNLDTLNTFVGDLNNVLLAREHHPDNDSIIAALTVKVAVMAIRIFEEGDRTRNFRGVRMPA